MTRPGQPCSPDDDGPELFRAAVADAQPLRPDGRVVATRPAPSAVPRQRERDEREALVSSLSDDIDVDTLLETDAELAFRRPGIGPDVLRRLRRGHWSIRAEVDLHGLRRDAARETLAEFIRESTRLGLRCVRVVHGKGLSSPGREPVLKPLVRRWLVQKEEVLAFCQARPCDGGAGALVVLLRGVVGTSRPMPPATTR